MSPERRAPRHRPDEATGAGPLVAELTLSNWEQVRGRILARLVPTARAGPMAIVPPTVAGFGPSPVSLDIGIDVAGGIVLPDRALLEALDVDRDAIWSAAMNNLDRRDRPPAVMVEADPVSLAIVAGGPWTTGLLVRPDRLHSIVERAAGSPGSTRPGPMQATMAGATVIVAPHPEVLIVGRARGIDRSGPMRELSRLADAVLGLATTLARADGGSRLPLVPLLPPTPDGEVLSRTGGFWNDVPVSEQPGLR